MIDENQVPGPASVAEAFGLDDEFKAPTEPETFPGMEAQPEPAQPELIQRQYDFGDGPMIFEGETEADITSQVIMAQNQRFQRLMLEGGRQQNYSPAPPQEYQEIPEPTNDELGALMLSFPKDPVGAFRKLMEYNTGIPFDHMMEDIHASRVIRLQKHAFDSGQTFVSRHQQYDYEGNHIGGDYYACPDNAERICRLLENEGKAETQENMEYAWSKLRAINGLIPYPEGYFDTEEPDPQYQTSGAISGRDSYYAESRPEFDEDDFIRAAASGQMSLEQMENEVRKRKLASFSR